MTDWFEIAHSPKDDLTGAEIKDIMEGLDTHFYAGEFTTVNRALMQMRPLEMNTLAIVCVSRYTFPVRERLQDWPVFIARCHDALKARGRGDELRGLTSDL